MNTRHQLTYLHRILFVALFLILSVQAHADWRDVLNIFAGDDKSQDGTAAMSTLTNTEMVEGLRDALFQGVKTAVKTLGQEDGFLANDLVKIPIPESLESVESTLRKLGQDEVADKFIAALNHAAEKAMPSAVSIFGEAISSMSINDAKDILEGPDDAATQYFRGRSDDDLRASFAPLVKEATDKVGVTATYKDLIKKLGPMASLLDTEKLDIDSYVTEKALDGLFLMIAEEEKKIREDPVARTTDLLKKVFAKL